MQYSTFNSKTNPRPNTTLPMYDYHAIAPTASAGVPSTTTTTGETPFLNVVLIGCVEQRRRIEQRELSTETCLLRPVGCAAIPTVDNLNEFRGTLLAVRNGCVRPSTTPNAKTDHPRRYIARIAVGIATARQNKLGGTSDL